MVVPLEESTTESVVVEVAHGVMVITLQRPEARNAINAPLADGLVDAFARLDDDVECRVAVLTGAGGTFCSGMDLKAFAATGDRPNLAPLLRSGANKPLIAAIEGHAVAGGLELALTCDILVAARDARLGIPEARVGLLATGGSLLRLPSRVPYGVAMELALTGDPISGEDAHAHGLVNHLAEPGAALERAVALAARIARNAPLSLLHAKAVLRDTRGRPEEEGWARQEVSRDIVFASEDGKEGARAFAEKREPRWSGR